MFTIWKLEDGEDLIKTFDRSRFHIKSTIKKYREISMKVTEKESKQYAGSKNGLEKGRYLIIPRYFYFLLNFKLRVVLNLMEILVNSC